ncbi:hypothetical protein MUN89_08970 [Halobacillus salinarum]|uniref:Uncharacterized protein n=1 Tax=Halobacillus salinarum TaxID=2932257 RepID=A0ABY4ENI7_9BACI|nr:hypothetical protein [Halobacillus salinarum]UOQ46027.1 hypothetical protein MUN89_08970 [Halobacillus salinarum]
MNYTAEMEKAMHQAHNLSFAEYSRKLDTRLEVEQRRQREFEQSQKMVEDMDRQLHR